MKKTISLILALAMVFTMLVVPVAAAEPYTATYTASLVGDTVPEAGQRFEIALTVSDISSGMFKNGGLAFEWPLEVATPIDYWTDTENVAVTTAAKCVGDIYDEYLGGRFGGKFSLMSSEVAANKFGASIYINTSADDKEPEAVADSLVMYKVAFMLNEGQSYEDFYFTLSEVEGFFNTDGIVSTPSDPVNTITTVGIEKKVEVVYESAVWQPGVNMGINTVASGVYELPETLVAGRTYEVSFKIHTHGIVGDTLVGLNNSDVMTSGAYFSNSTIMMKVDGATVKFRNGGAIDSTEGTLSSNETTVDVKVVVDLINNKWGATFTENGTEVVTKSGMDFRNANLPINALVLADNNKNAGCLTATELEVVDTTPASVGTVTFKYVCDGVELDTAERNGETGATVSVDATTLTVGGVKYEAPAASGVVGTDVTVEVECVKYEKVAVNYVAGDAVVKTVTLEGKAGDEVAYDAVKFTNAGKVYEAAAGTVTVDPADLTVEVDAAEVANTVAAYKTGYYNVTQNAVGVYPADRALAGTDALYSADWNDVRYGEMMFALDVEEGNAVNTAVLTLVPGDIMTSHVKTFDIYAADPATYNTANDVATLTVVGSGEWTDVDVATDVTLDLTQYFATYPEATEVLLLYKTVGGLSGVYGASTETAPYITYEIGEYEEPATGDEPSTGDVTEPSTGDSEEPSSDVTEPSTGDDEEPSSDVTEPSTGDDEEPSSDVTEPSTGDSEEPSSDVTEPSEEPGDVTLPLTATKKDVAGKIAIDFALNEDYTGDVELNVGDSVVVVISYLKDGKPYQAIAVSGAVNADGVVEFAADVVEGLEVAGVSVLVGVNALEAITAGNLGIPAGVWK